MRVCLIIPPSCGQEYYARVPSLGLLYIAAVLEKAGHEVLYLDCVLEKMDHEAFHKFVKDEMPDVVGISVFTAARFSAFECAKIVKGINKGIKVVCGGPHATVLSREILEAVPEIDAVIRGEAEYAFKEYLDKGPSAVDGVTYREGNKIIFNKDRGVLENLDELPHPAWHLADMDKYFKEYARSHAAYKRLPIAGIITGRGCSRRCIFCAAPKLSPRIRRHSPQYICDMIRLLMEKYGVRDIYFLDDTFTDNERWLSLLKEELEKNKIRIPFQCQGIAIMTDKTIEMLRAMGCYYIYIGAESGSQRILDFMNKAIRVEDYDRSVRCAVKNGMMVHTHWLVGMPQEEASDLRLTLRKIKELPHHHYSVAVLDIYPGTKLSETLDENSLNRQYSVVAANHILLNAHLFCISGIIKYIIVLLHENIIEAVFSYVKQTADFVSHIDYLPFRSDLISDLIGLSAAAVNRVFGGIYRYLKALA